MQIIEHVDIRQLRRSIEAGTQNQREAVMDILHQVKTKGHNAVITYTRQFDKAEVQQCKVDEEEIGQAYEQLEDHVVQALQHAISQVRHYHEQQQSTSWFSTSETGTLLGQLVRPIERVGVYVPGGTAAYPSSVIMSVVPAQVAGVEQIVIITPPNEQGHASAGVLVAADLLGVQEIYKVGGAQAIAALAYGTEQIEAVDKIVGPGNVYVTLAKKEVFGLVDIDMVAGPTDILVIADEKQDPAYVAADLLSQAEHDKLSSAICVTTNMALAKAVQAEVSKQLEHLPRKEIAQASIDGRGAIYVVKDLPKAFEVSNAIAPEHLELMIEEPMQWLGLVKHAGAIFLGSYSSEPLGDYIAGPSHVLPTYGTARFSSGLNVDTFIKKSSLISYSSSDLQRDAAHVINLANYEGLTGHAKAIQVRMERIPAKEESK